MQVLINASTRFEMPILFGGLSKNFLVPFHLSVLSDAFQTGDAIQVYIR